MCVGGEDLPKSLKSLKRASPPEFRQWSNIPPCSKAVSGQGSQIVPAALLEATKPQDGGGVVPAAAKAGTSCHCWGGEAVPSSTTTSEAEKTPLLSRLRQWSQWIGEPSPFPLLPLRLRNCPGRCQNGETASGWGGGGDSCSWNTDELQAGGGTMPAAFAAFAILQMVGRTSG